MRNGSWGTQVRADPQGSTVLVGHYLCRYVRPVPIPTPHRDTLRPRLPVGLRVSLHPQTSSRDLPGTDQVPV